MNKEIENLVKKSVIRDVQIALLNAKANDLIIPDVVFDIIEEVEARFMTTEDENDAIAKGLEADQIAEKKAPEETYSSKEEYEKSLCGDNPQDDR
jgi:ribosomal protein S1